MDNQEKINIDNIADGHNTSGSLPTGEGGGRGRSLILAIESSCYDTSAAVMEGRVLLSNVTASQKVHGFVLQANLFVMTTETLRKLCLMLILCFAECIQKMMTIPKFFILRMQPQHSHHLLLLPR